MLRICWRGSTMVSVTWPSLAPSVLSFLRENAQFHSGHSGYFLRCRLSFKGFDGYGCIKKGRTSASGAH
jgi:hypothetical protein